jgi:hypothetical protein
MRENFEALLDDLREKEMEGQALVSCPGCRALRRLGGVVRC